MRNKILCWFGYHDEYLSHRYDCWYLFKCRRPECTYVRTIGPCEGCLNKLE